MNGLPTVRIDDILVHPRDNDLILGTHGRSIYIMDDITRAAADDRRGRGGRRHAVRSAAGGGVAERHHAEPLPSGGNKHFRGENPAPGTAISYYLKSVPAGDVKITITDVTGRVVREIAGTKDVRPQPRPVEPSR